MMTLIGFVKLFKKIQNFLVKSNIMEEPREETELVVKKLTLVTNPRYANGKKWGYRSTKLIDKIIVHQELGEANTIAVHNYHISPESHLKPGVGAPAIAYHYTIEKDGTVYDVNPDTSVVWHCRGQNLNSIGIMLVGDFDGPTHKGRSKPTEDQIKNLKKLLTHLCQRYGLLFSEVYGHCDFGKQNCPGTLVYEEVLKFRDSGEARV